MIEWIQHWDEMRFYYWSGLNWLILLPVHLGLLFALGMLWWWLAKVWKWAWVIVILLLPVVAIAPWWEELDIAYNFGQLCKKDAGVLIYKTVEVGGFYDATRPTHASARSKAAADDLDKGGYQFYEMPLPDMKGGPTRVVHLAKANGIWSSTVLDHPTARYHYQKDSGVRMAHKIYRQSSRILDVKSQEVLGQYIRYSRESPWFFISLGDPGLGCDGPDGGPNTKHSFLIYRDVLKPIGSTKGEGK